MGNFRLLILFLFIAYMIRYKFQFDLHMFQQNSYRANRYLKWTFGKNNRMWKGTDSLIFLSMIFWYLAEHKAYPLHDMTIGSKRAISICLAKNPSMIISIIFITISAFLILYTEDAHKLLMSVKPAKKPLVYTARVKRLMTTQILTFIIILGYLYGTKQPSLIMCICVFVLSYFSYLLLILANFINSPIEKAINNWYINDAKRILAENTNRIIIGITGSYGKTSTKQILSQVLSSKYTVLATPESYNTLMGVVKTIRTSLRPIHDVFIVEMGAKQAGDIKEICELVHPNIGIITSIGKQHLETFKTIENIKNTKNELFMHLKENGIAFVNLSDEYIKYLPKRKDVNYIVFGTGILDDSQDSYTAQNIQITKDGTSFTFIPASIKINNSTENHINDGNDSENANENNKNIVIKTKLLGAHNVGNLLSALCIADILHIDLVKSMHIISAIKPVEHRLSIKRGACGETIIDDAFNANPVGSKNALEVLSKINGNKKYIITPGMIELGDELDKYNMKFGEYIADACDYVVLVGKKQTEAIAQGLSNKSYPSSQIHIAENFLDGYEHLQGMMNAHDVLLIENDLPDAFA